MGRVKRKHARFEKIPPLTLTRLGSRQDKDACKTDNASRLTIHYRVLLFVQYDFTDVLAKKIHSVQATTCRIILKAFFCCKVDKKFQSVTGSS